MTKIVALVIGLGLAAGCGDGTLGGGPDGGGGGPPINTACSALGACACYQAIDRCQMRTEPCWCADACGAPIACVCGGGQFLACEDKSPATTTMYCSAQLARVQQACAAQPFIGGLDSVCSTQNANCVGACLANLGSCSEIDCRFCPVCDCAVPEGPSPFAECLASCQ